MTSFVLLDSEEKLPFYPCDQFFAILKQLQTKSCLYLLARIETFHGYFERHILTRLIFEIKK